MVTIFIANINAIDILVYNIYRLYYNTGGYNNIQYNIQYIQKCDWLVHIYGRFDVV